MLRYAILFKVIATTITRGFLADSKIPVKGIQFKVFLVLGRPCSTALEIIVKVMFSSKGPTLQTFFSVFWTGSSLNKLERKIGVFVTNFYTASRLVED